MQKKILVPNGNYTDIRLIQALKKLGLFVITSGNAPELAGHRYADMYAPHDYSDYKGMLELAKELKIDYVSACSNDFGVTTAAYIAEHMGLPGHDSFEAARIIAEKDRFKKFALENGLQVIPSQWFDQEETALDYLKNAAYPLIIKPNDLGGGKGVSRVDCEDAGRRAVAWAFEMSRSKHIVIEPYIEGTQHSIIAFLVDKKVVTYASSNEYPCRNNPFLVGFGAEPADYIQDDAPVLIAQIEKIAQLLNLKDGVFNVQYRRANGKPLIMECMRRCLGNYALKIVSDSTGIEWEEWIAKSYLGMDCSGIPHCTKQQSVIHYYIQAPHNGIVKNITISPEVQKYIYDAIMQWEPGMVVERYNVEMLGFLFLKFPDLEERDKIVNLIEDSVIVEMEK